MENLTSTPKFKFPEKDFFDHDFDFSVLIF